MDERLIATMNLCYEKYPIEVAISKEGEKDFCRKLQDAFVNQGGLLLVTDIYGRDIVVNLRNLTYVGFGTEEDT